jgi:hypothetical protein
LEWYHRMNVSALDRLQKTVEFVYGEKAPPLFQRIQALLQAERLGPGTASFTEGDALLITYGDIFRPPGNPSEGAPGRETSSEGGLPILTAFLQRWNRHFTYVHLLPFHPYSSDDGFFVFLTLVLSQPNWKFQRWWDPRWRGQRNGLRRIRADGSPTAERGLPNI